MLKNAKLRTLSLVTALCIFLSVFSVGAAAGSNDKSGADAIADIAISQVGTREYYSGGERSKYGDYFGYSGPWCGAFVSWCARQAGIPENVIPTEFSSTEIREYFMERGLYRKAPAYGGNYIPKKGDIVFFSWSGNYNDVDHVGIAYEANSEYVKCVEGNCPDRVTSYNRSYSSKVLGFASPDYVSMNGGKDNAVKTGSYILDSAMRLRTAPVSGSIICEIPSGTVVVATEIRDNWGKVTYNGSTGWISLDYSRPFSPSSPDKNHGEPGEYRLKKNMNFRSKPSKNADYLGLIEAGNIVTVTEVTSDGWGKIAYDGKTGWISLDWSIRFAPEVDWLVVDLSKWQPSEAIDFEQLKASGVEAVILRCGGRFANRSNPEIYSDDLFLTHYKNAKAAGLHVGTYFFSYAMTKEGIEEEADFVIKTIEENNIQLDMPVFIDMEDYGDYRPHEAADRTTCTMLLDSFCRRVEKAGYYAGIYASSNFLEDKVMDKIYENRAIWVAEWPGKDSDRKFPLFNGRTDIWQYTENGRLEGSTVDLDLNRCYVDFPSRINVDESKVLKGDVDGNGSVGASDARLILRKSVSIEVFNPVQLFAGDMNKDGSITSRDAREVLRISVFG